MKTITIPYNERGQEDHIIMCYRGNKKKSIGTLCHLVFGTKTKMLFTKSTAEHIIATGNFDFKARVMHVNDKILEKIRKRERG